MHITNYYSVVFSFKKITRKYIYSGKNYFYEYEFILTSFPTREQKYYEFTVFSRVVDKTREFYHYEPPGNKR